MTGHCEHCRQDCWGDEDGFHSNTGETVQWDAGYCPNCAERAAIVAWLREYDSRQPGFHNMRVTRNVANDIEHGEHLIGGPVIDPLRGAVATGYSIGIKDDDA